jgi:hypothetical protein
MRVSFRSIEFPPNKVRLLVFPVCPLADEPGVNNRRACKGTGLHEQVRSTIHFNL